MWEVCTLWTVLKMEDEWFRKLTAIASLVACIFASTTQNTSGMISLDLPKPTFVQRDFWYKVLEKMTV